jgi:hypothetical protein
VYIPALTLFPSGGYSAEQDVNVYDTTGTKVPMIQWNNASTGATYINGRTVANLNAAPGYGVCLGQWIAGFGTPNNWFCEDAFGQGTATPLNSSYKGIGVQQGVSDGVYGDLFWAKLADGTLVYEIGATGAAGNLAFGKINGSFICTIDNAHGCYKVNGTALTGPSINEVGSSTNAAGFSVTASNPSGGNVQLEVGVSSASTARTALGVVKSFYGGCGGNATAGTATGMYPLLGQLASSTGTCSAAYSAPGALMVNSSGTVQNLRCSTNVAGISGSDGVCTVYINGTASAVTCTIGTGTSCTSGGLTAAITAGQRVSINILPATGTTALNDLNAMFDIQY